MINFLNLLFGCSHRRTTFPITPSRKRGFVNSSKETYVVCLTCGQEFVYNWQDMKLGAEVTQTAKPCVVPNEYGQ